METVMNHAENVARGIKLLDEKEPEWRSKIDKDELNMDDCTECILGQTFGNFWSALPKVGLPEEDGPEWEELAQSHGFYLVRGECEPWTDLAGRFDELRDEWVRQLNKST